MSAKVTILVTDVLSFMSINFVNCVGMVCCCLAGGEWQVIMIKHAPESK